ncbi:type II toxin-antitoxin system Phd/YefM family antitoxin [Desulforhabdus sp. TSK]|uniref:type II toxin-antitoxin system Phd/YefM family antitoxin n=1 Tax=Desulforhabdus sp. TSK TaxID=2925014 RepID=UPI001FC86B1C|nr:type II toxin-antitoxin system Phd/YefM family antitoxin [Desulforhabdus sp. TSK]
MQKTISAMKARQNLGQVMNEVALRGDDYIIERAGKPLVAIIPIEKYQKLQRPGRVLRLGAAVPGKCQECGLQRVG